MFYAKLYSTFIVLILMCSYTSSLLAQICAGGAQAGCTFAQTFNLTGANINSTGSATLSLNTTFDYTAAEGAEAPSICGLTFLNGYDEDAGLSPVEITLDAANTVDVTGLTSIDYCFYFYDDSNILDLPSDPINYSNPLQIQLITDAGNTSNVNIAPSSLDLVALENGEWIYICQTFTLPSGATEITGINHQVELESSVDGRCTDANGGYSVANTCEVFGVAPDGVTTCPVDIITTPPSGCDANNGTLTIGNN